MPASSGSNPRAVEARARKKAAQDEVDRVKLQAKEDAYWKDDHKINNAKLSRKSEMQHKAEEQRARKAENRRLADAETVELHTQMKLEIPIKKLSRADIASRAAATAALAQQQKAKEKEDGAPFQLVENPNQQIREQIKEARLRGEDFVEATGLEDAVRALTVDEVTDRNPERRMKAAFKSYEDEWLPKLRLEYPTLKRSQLLDMLQKQWKKASENPLVRTTTGVKE